MWLERNSGQGVLLIVGCSMFGLDKPLQVFKLQVPQGVVSLFCPPSQAYFNTRIAIPISITIPPRRFVHVPVQGIVPVLAFSAFGTFTNHILNGPLCLHQVSFAAEGRKGRSMRFRSMD